MLLQYKTIVCPKGQHTIRVKFFRMLTPYTAWVQRLVYVLGPGSLSLVVFVWCQQLLQTGDTAATRSITGKTPPTKQQLLELADPWIDFC